MAVGLSLTAEPGNFSHHIYLGWVADRSVSILLEVGLISAAQSEHQSRPS